MTARPINVTVRLVNVTVRLGIFPCLQGFSRIWTDFPSFIRIFGIGDLFFCPSIVYLSCVHASNQLSAQRLPGREHPAHRCFTCDTEAAPMCFACAKPHYEHLVSDKCACKHFTSAGPACGTLRASCLPASAPLYQNLPMSFLPISSLPVIFLLLGTLPRNTLPESKRLSMSSMLSAPCPPAVDHPIS